MRSSVTRPPPRPNDPEAAVRYCEDLQIVDRDEYGAYSLTEPAVDFLERFNELQRYLSQWRGRAYEHYHRSRAASPD